MKRLWVVLICLTNISMVVVSVETVLAPMEVVGEVAPGESLPKGGAFSQTVVNYLKELDRSGILKPSVKSVPKGESHPRSILDASSFSAYYGLDMLVFGRLSCTPEYLDGYLQVYDVANGDIRQRIYSRDRAGRYERLAEDLAGKLFEYLTDELGLAPVYPSYEVEHSLWDLRGRVGYWSPMGSWRDTLSGICSVEAAGFLTPEYPLGERGPWLYGLRYGVSLGYDLGVSTPGYEEFTFHGIRTGIPVEFYVTRYNKRSSEFSLGITPFFMLDVLVQNRRYEGTYTTSTAGTGVSLSGGARYDLSESSAVGLGLEISSVFYDPPRYEIRPSLAYEYRFPGKRKEKVDD